MRMRRFSIFNSSKIISFKIQLLHVVCNPRDTPIKRNSPGAFWIHLAWYTSQRMVGRRPVSSWEVPETFGTGSRGWGTVSWSPDPDRENNITVYYYYYSHCIIITITTARVPRIFTIIADSWHQTRNTKVRKRSNAMHLHLHHHNPFQTVLGA